MNRLGRITTCFQIQHAALKQLKGLLSGIRPSAVKLYVWLCYKSSRKDPIVMAKGSEIEDRTNLSEKNTITNARTALVNAGLIAATRITGPGGGYAHALLDMTRREPLDWSKLPPYFQFPVCVLLRDIFRSQSGASVLMYADAMALLNQDRQGRSVFWFHKKKLARRLHMSLPTLRTAMKSLTEGPPSYLRYEAGELEVLHPETGMPLDAVDRERDGSPLFFLSTGSGKRTPVEELLRPENFKDYYLQELPDLNPVNEQQNTNCPFHNDGTPSLSVNLREGVWHCHACDHENEQWGMVGFEMTKLGTDDRREAWRSVCKKLGVRLFGQKRGKPTHEHRYTSENGELLYIVRRYENGSAAFYHPEGTRLKPRLGQAERTLYQLPDVLAAEVVLFTEGEKKADILNSLRLRDWKGDPVAVTTSGGVSSWRSNFAELLRGKKVVMLADSDEEGQRHATQVRDSLTFAGVANTEVNFDAYGNDVRDFLAKNNGTNELLEHIDCEWLESPNFATSAIGTIDEI